MAKILIVDDEAELRNVLNDILVEQGYQIISAADGNEAKEKLKSHTFDLVISDIKMPNSDGIELLHWIKTNKPTPVILISGYLDYAKSKSSDIALADEFMSKPFGIENLVKTVESILSKEKIKTYIDYKDKKIFWPTLIFSALSILIGVFTIIDPIKKISLPNLFVKKYDNASAINPNDYPSIFIDQNLAVKYIPKNSLSEVDKKNLTGRVEIIEKYILESPEKALSITLLKKELDLLQQKTQTELSVIRKELDFSWEIRLWIFTTMLSIIGVMITLWPLKKKR